MLQMDMATGRIAPASSPATGPRLKPMKTTISTDSVWPPLPGIIAQRIFDADGNFEAPPTSEVLTRDAVRAGAEIARQLGDDTQAAMIRSAMEFDALCPGRDDLGREISPTSWSSQPEGGARGQTIAALRWRRM